MTAPRKKPLLVTPDEPPRLTPGAAQVLLRILRAAADQLSNTRQKDQPKT